jgi:transposase
MVLTDDEYRFVVKSRLKGISIRETAKKLKRNRATVAKYYNGNKRPGEKKPSENFEPRSQEGARAERRVAKEEVLKFCEAKIEEHKDRPPKQRLDKKQLHEMVHDRFVNIPYSTLCRWLKERNMMNYHEVYINLQFDPGEAMQADFCDYNLMVTGEQELVTAKLFCLSLAYSNERFVAILQDEKRHTLIYALQMGLEHFGGVPREIIFDNMAQLVDSGSGKNAIINPVMRKFSDHYGFEPVCANACRGNEKGLVENLCKSSRPMLSGLKPVKSLREAQDHISMKLAEYRESAKLKGKSASVMEMSMEDRAALGGLPMRRFADGEQMDLEVTKFRTVRFDTCEYSVPDVNPGTVIGVRATPYEITCYHMGIILCSHLRSLRRHAHVLDALHYLDIYQKKPRSVKNSAALKSGRLPEELDEFRSKCRDRNVGEQLVRIMLLSREHDPKNVSEAVRKANSHRNPTADLVCGILNVMEHKSAAGDDGPGGGSAALDDFEVDPLSVYDDMIGGEKDWDETPDE